MLVFFLLSSSLTDLIIKSYCRCFVWFSVFLVKIHLVELHWILAAEDQSKDAVYMGKTAAVTSTEAKFPSSSKGSARLPWKGFCFYSLKQWCTRTVSCLYFWHKVWSGDETWKNMNIVCLIFTKGKIWHQIPTLDSSSISRKPDSNSLFHR